MRKFRTGDLIFWLILIFPAFGLFFSLRWNIQYQYSDNTMINATNAFIANYWARLWMAIIMLFYVGVCFGILLIQFLNRKSHMTTERLDKIALLETEIKILTELKYTRAYTGSLEKLEQRDYVPYDDISKMLLDKREELRKTKNNN